MANKRAGKKSLAANDFLQPSAPINVSATDVGTNRPYNDGAAVVSFELPALSPAATSYTVTASSGQTATGSSSPLTVTGIPVGSRTFTVTATNAAGTSQSSSASSSVSITTVPENTTFVSATDVGTNRTFGSGAVTVSFTAGSNGGKAITSYTAVSAGPGSGPTATGGSTSLTIEGLNAPGSMYFYGIATNANGSGYTNGTSTMIDVTCVPGTPYSVTATSPSGATYDTVSWNAPNTGGKAITNYHVIGSDGTSGDTSSTSININQGAGETQSYTVYATNANGSGQTSASSGNVTTFSFTPFSFTPFSFTPFSFTPYYNFAFTPFSFTPYYNFAFTPFSFTPFSFTPFSFTPAFSFTPFGFFR
jgi:titin